MAPYPCAVAGCQHIAWRVCERCGRPCCVAHARWYKRELVRGSWATFAFVCYTCEPLTAGEDVDEEEGPAAEAGSGRTQ